MLKSTVRIRIEGIPTNYKLANHDYDIVSKLRGMLRSILVDELKEASTYWDGTLYRMKDKLDVVVLDKGFYLVSNEYAYNNLADKVIISLERRVKTLPNTPIVDPDDWAEDFLYGMTDFHHNNYSPTYHAFVKPQLSFYRRRR